MSDTVFHVGTSGYSYPKWKGSFYPKDLSAKRMLHYYGQRFRAVEMNDTSYPACPRPRSPKRGRPRSRRTSGLSSRPPQRITHFQRLRGVAESVSGLLDVVAALKGKIRALLFQLPPNFKKDVSRLQGLLALLPARQRVAFEFRHPSWLDQDVFDLLRDHQAALRVAETEDGVEARLLRTADWAYFRLRLADYGDSELKGWVDRMRQHKWREVFVFFKHEDEGKGPDFAGRLMRLVTDPTSSCAGNSK